MHNAYSEIFAEIAKIADLCLKPYRYSVLCPLIDSGDVFMSETFIELLIRLECRTALGERCSHNDLEVEIYRSSDQLNITLARYENPDAPILWQGKYSLWMDGNSGKRCEAPVDSTSIEALARRLRAMFTSMATP